MVLSVLFLIIFPWRLLATHTQYHFALTENKNTDNWQLKLVCKEQRLAITKTRWTAFSKLPGRKASLPFIQEWYLVWAVSCPVKVSFLWVLKLSRVIWNLFLIRNKWHTVVFEFCLHIPSQKISYRRRSCPCLAKLFKRPHNSSLRDRYAKALTVLLLYGASVAKRCIYDCTLYNCLSSP